MITQYILKRGVAFNEYPSLKIHFLKGAVSTINYYDFASV